MFFNNNIEREAPFNGLYGTTWWLHLINYLEPLLAANSRLIGSTLSPGWLQIAYPLIYFCYILFSIFGLTNYSRSLLKSEILYFLKLI